MSDPNANCYISRLVELEQFVRIIRQIEAFLADHRTATEGLTTGGEGV